MSSGEAVAIPSGAVLVTQTSIAKCPNATTKENKVVK